ncbi:hypothetical protein TNCV_1601181 [Trichonephila clavipes]|nr:hypothetical protein TNCV_1601181 [Trichonephila clavipes]
MAFIKVLTSASSPIDHKEICTAAFKLFLEKSGYVVDRDAIYFASDFQEHPCGHQATKYGVQNVIPAWLYHPAFIETPLQCYGGVMAPPLWRSYLGILQFPS